MQTVNRAGHEWEENIQISVMDVGVIFLSISLFQLRIT